MPETLIEFLSGKRCLAQLINVIAPVMTNATSLFKQTIYYPFSLALELAKGTVLDLEVEAPTYEVAEMGQVSYLDVAATQDGASGKIAMFVLNRDLSKPHTVEVNWEAKPPDRLVSANLLTGDDLKAINSFEAPNRVAPQPFEKPATSGGKTKFEVPARSYTVLQWEA